MNGSNIGQNKVTKRRVNKQPPIQSNINYKSLSWMMWHQQFSKSELVDQQIGLLIGIWLTDMLVAMSQYQRRTMLKAELKQ